jgi:3-oxoacyl-[acyl-carrier protein] reductase
MAPERGTALVTGAGRGIGFAIAESLWRAGFKVAMASLEPASAAQSQDMLQDARCRYYGFDLADISQHQGLLDRLEGELGPISCLVNNAGVTSLVRGDMLELTLESFDRCVAVNLRGTFFLTQAVARRFVKSDSSGTYRSILTISSANAELVGENRADYCITKSSLSMMTKLFAARLAEHGIGVFEIRPGIIKTEMTEPVFAKYDPYIASGGVPMRRWGLPGDVAQAAVTLATGGLPFATGMHVDIGGGLQLHRLQV